MALVNVEALLKPLDGENPCGENLRWDRRFLELERLAEGKEEQVSGDSIIPAQEPDWREVRDVCVELLARGKHLRIAVLITLAAVRLEGFPGLRDGLRVLQGFITDYWDLCPPQLDAEDNNDPTERVNALAPLSTPPATYGDKIKFLDRVQAAPLTDSRQLGRFSLRDVAIASGTMTVPDSEFEGRNKPTMDLIAGAFAETDKEKLTEIAVAAEEAMASVEAIEKIFTEKCGSGVCPDLRLLKTMLRDAALQVRRNLDPGAAEAGADAAGGDPGASGGGGGVGGGGAAPQRLAGEITSNDDVIRVLDKIIKFYESNEPSSPVPLFVKCARKVVRKPFLEIYTRYLEPSDVNLLKRIAEMEESS